MSRYVDADKLYDAVSDTWSGSQVIDTNDILEFIETFETADVGEEKQLRFEYISNIIESEQHKKSDYVKSFIFDSVNFIIGLRDEGFITYVDIWDAINYYECCNNLFEKIIATTNYYNVIVKRHVSNFPECVKKPYLSQYLSNWTDILKDLYAKSPHESVIRYIEEDLNAYSFKHLFFCICQEAERLIDNEIRTQTER